MDRLTRVSTFFFALSLLGSALFAGTPTKSSLLVIDHVTVIEVSGGPARADQMVIISGDTIMAVARSGSIQVPKGAQLVDARGTFLISGLCDMHKHIAGISAKPSWSMHVLIPLLVANGITGVRDVGATWTRSNSGGGKY